MTLFREVPARALAIFAHPDDAEVSCAGTLASWTAAGCEGYLVICNAGDKGSDDRTTDPVELTAVRAGEAKAAAEVMGLADHEMLGYPDGEIENTSELRQQLVQWVRALRPDVVICPDPTAVFFGDTYVNHHDHRVVGSAALDAVAPMASLPLYFPEAGSPHSVGTVLLTGTFEPDCWVDIGAHLGTKIAALRCHRSQVGAGASVVDEVVRSRAAEAAASSGLADVSYAEGFRRLRLPSGVRSGS